MTKLEEQLKINELVQKDLVKDLGREAQAKQYYLERCNGAFNMLEDIRDKLGTLVEFPMDDMNRLEITAILKDLEILDYDREDYPLCMG